MAQSSNGAVSLAIEPPNSIDNGNTLDWFNAANFKTLQDVTDLNGGLVAGGDVLEYTITVTNTGTLSSINSMLMEIVPAGTTYVPGSTTLNGSAVSDVSGTLPLINGLSIKSPAAPAGLIYSATTATVTFQVTVNSNLLPGTSINAQAKAYASLIVNDLSDDPGVDGNGNGDPEDDTDVTTIMVGSAPLLQAVTTVVDVNGGNVVVGDVLRYTTVITNTGNADATSVVFGNAMPNNATYAAGSIVFNAVAQTDASGDDSADYGVTTASAVTVNAGTIAPTDYVTIVYDVTVDAGTPAGTIIASQGSADSAETPALPTDADGNTANGYQATTIVVGNDPVVNVVMTVLDLNSGEISVGDTLRYQITVTNIGGSAATGVVLGDVVPTYLTYSAGSIRVDNVLKTDANDGDNANYNFTTPNAATINIGNLGAGVQKLITFDVTIDAGVPDGTSITNTANTTSSNAAAASDSETIYIGGTPGKGSIGGSIYLDKNGDDVLQPGEAFEGWTVRVKTCANGEPVDTPVYETTTDADGHYRIVNLPAPESYTVDIYDADGVFMGDIDAGVCEAVVEGENIVNYNLPIDPSGYVYDTLTGDVIPGAVVEFIDVSGGHGPAGALVPSTDLVGPNTMTTGTLGFYSFVLRPGAVPAGGNIYEIRVTPPTGYGLSVVHPPVSANTTAGLLDIASSEIDAPASGIGNVDDKSAAPFNAVGGSGAQYRYAYKVRYEAGDSGEIFQNNIPLDQSGVLSIRVTKQANKKEVSVGGIVTYTVTLQNVASIPVTNISLEDHIPAGFKYVSGRAILDGTSIADPTGTRDLLFSVGSIAAGETRTLKYQLVVGTGVSFGTYTNTIYAKASSVIVSNQASAKVKIVPDPLFDMGTVIGKVFVDANANGRQDHGEKPVPQARIMTEEGTSIVTDDFGRYHLAAVVPGRHAFRLVESTLPEGAILTTPKVVVADVTEGLPLKINFGIRLPAGSVELDTPFSVTQDTSTPEPRLSVALRNAKLIVTPDGLKEPARFRIFTNYHLFVDTWVVQVVDRDTRRPIWEFSGNRDNIFNEFAWDGRDENGALVSIERTYAYRVIVEDKERRRDMTAFVPIRIERDDGRVTVNQDTIDEQLEKEQKWEKEQADKDAIESRQIPVHGSLVKIESNRGRAIRSITVNGPSGIAEVIPLDEQVGMTAQDLINHPGVLEDAHHGAQEESDSRAELILPNGEYQFTVAGAKPGSVTPQVIGTSAGLSISESDAQDYSKTVKVGDDYMMFVAMGDSKMGYNLAQGDIEPISRNDRYQEGFWKEGKLAYYLKGKVRGKYLVTSSLDTDRDKNELFRNLDPDKYYPVYGDESNLNASDSDTQGIFYLLVEWDKSSAKWGNFATEFTDTKLAQFNQTLYGSKVHLESVATNEHGDANTKLIAFNATVHQKSAHNEFLGTGGSLFYLKHKDIVEGSQNIRLEVRDRLTGLVLSTKAMESGFDYTIDYDSGRVTFSKPVSMVAGSDLLISTQLLEGNPVYVVVDYSYEDINPLTETTAGVRAQKAIGERAVIGGTYVKEEQSRTDYQLTGTDTKIYIGENTTITGEYAETESETGNNFVSTDGGLSFTGLPNDSNSSGKAYATTLESYFLENSLGVTANYQWIDRNFSTANTGSEQGKELIGFMTTYDVDETLRLVFMHDIQRLLDGGNAQSSSQVGASETQTTTVQAAKTLAHLKITSELRHQTVKRSVDASAETGSGEDAVAVRADYAVREGLDVYAEQQLTLNSTASNHQTTIGGSMDVTENVNVRLEQKVGTQGTASSIGTTANFDNKLTLSGDYTVLTSPDGVSTSTLGLGSGMSSTDSRYSVSSDVDHSVDGSKTTDVSSIAGSYKVDEDTEVHGSIGLNGVSAGEHLTTTTFGTTKKVSEELSVTSDKTYASSETNKITGNTYSLTRTANGRDLTGSYAKQLSEGDKGTATSDIVAATGEITDEWAVGGNYEKGRVHNLDGTYENRSVFGVQFGYLDQDQETGENALKWANKLELRLDDGVEDHRQHLIQTLLEGKANDDWTLFTKIDWSQTKNTTTGLTEAEYKEFSLGAAFRPVDYDRLNMLGKYSFIEDDAPVSQVDVSDIEHERFQVLATEAIYDLTKRWQLAEKIALKWGEEWVTGFEPTSTLTWLWINRVNYKLTKHWMLGAEYRYLAQRQAQDNKQGVLLEVSRKIGSFIDVGAGYNFTDFNDDLTALSYTVQGPYVRVTGTLYDRTEEEKAVGTEQWLDEHVEAWAYKMTRELLSDKNYADENIRAAKIDECKAIIYARVAEEKDIEDLIRRAKQARHARKTEMADILDRKALMRVVMLKQNTEYNELGVFENGVIMDLKKAEEGIRKRLGR